MNIAIIPIKNIRFENEEAYIENKYQKGLKLKRKGLLFYTFEKVTPEHIQCEIELSDYEQSQSENDWSILLSQKTRYQKKFKTYYITTNMESRLMVEKEQRLDYYKYYQQFYKNMANGTFFFVAIVLTMFLINIKVPLLIKFLSIPILALSYYFVRLSQESGQIVEELSRISGQFTGLEPEFIVGFNKKLSINPVMLKEALLEIGYVQKVDDYTFIIKSPLNKAEIATAIIGTNGIKKEDFKVMHTWEHYEYA